MKITFADKKLEKLIIDDRKLLREFGRIRAAKVKTRLDQLNAIFSLEEARYISGNYHELKGTRKGQWACDLDQPYRLIFVPHEKPIPVNESGQCVWVEILGVEVIEITNYHKEK